MRKCIGHHFVLCVLILIITAGVSGQTHPTGDLNEDHKVNFADLLLLAERWLDPHCYVPACPVDLDGVDGVNFLDFARLAANWRVRGMSAVISEFMAANGSQLPLGPGELLDEDGDSSDWIEIYNPTDEVIDLSGWHLTDDASELTQWRFGDGILLNPYEFLIVFASGKDRPAAGAPLHTNFRLSADGGYLALADDKGRVVHAYANGYPRQLTNISYGLRQYGRTLVPPGATAAYHVPRQEDAALDWKGVSFVDTNWQRGSTGLGFGFGGAPRVAYNDCVYSSGQYIGENVTTYGIGNGFSGLTSGPLIDQATGEDMGITVAFTQSGGVNWQAAGTGGRDCAVGTDAYATFGTIADMTGVIYYGAVGWWVDLTFTGLDPSTEYTFATSSARGAYDNRYTVYTLIGADTYANASTSGVAVLAENKVRFNTGDNLAEGYVARWTGITAADGTFTVRAEADPSSPDGQRAYAFDVFMLQGGMGGENLRAQMLDVSASLWTRLAFDLGEGEADLFDTLTLSMKYDDGFIAYLNGVEVVRDGLVGEPQWDSHAGQDRPDTLSRQWARFDLSDHIRNLREGRNVLAIHALNDSAGDPNFLVLPELTAASSLGVPQYFTTATPGALNVPGALDIVADTTFSMDRGFYDAPFTVEIGTQTAGATIHFTTDGTWPDETRGQAYTGPFTVDKTTTLRAMAFKPGWLSTNVDTQTYIFLDDVLAQPAAPAGFPGGWDYGMDTKVVTPNLATLKEDLKSLPTMSLVLDVGDLFGPSGIYTNWGSQGPGWERAGSLELIHPDGSDGFQVNCGVRIYGGVGRQEAKKTFRLLFKRMYGDSKLRYPLFGPDAADAFDTIILRANFNDGYVWGGAASQYIRDEYIRRLQIALGHPTARGTFVHLYVNGLYWGLYNPVERPDTAFSASYYDGAKEDWDGINSGEPTGESQTAAWNTLMSLAGEGLSTNAAYQKIQGRNPDGSDNPNLENYLDVESYIAFLIANFYGGNNDWMSHNWYAGRLRGPDSTGWKAYTWDAEWVMGIGSGLGQNSVNHTTTSNFLLKPYTALRQNAEFQLLFADYVHRAFFNSGLLYVDAAAPGWDPAHPERNRPAQVYAAMAAPIERAMICESARWGDAKTASPYTIADWRYHRDWMLHTYMPQRSAIVLDQLKNAGLYPGVPAPVFAVNGQPRHGGQTATGDALAMTAPQGTVYYTTDGSDPRTPSWASVTGEMVTLIAETAAKRYIVPTGPLASETVPGTILREYWLNIDGTDIASLTSNPAYPENPSGQTEAATFEGPVDWAENYGTRIRGYLHPPADGDYTFWVASDDAGELWLSPNATSGNATRIAHVPGWTSSRQWTKYPEQKSAAITLTAGKKYYIEALHKEGGGGDNIAVAWQGPGLIQQVIDGRYLSPASTEWNSVSYDDSVWPSATGTIGYEAAPGDPVNYADLIHTDIRTAMHNVNTTCYVRIPFTLVHADYNNLSLRLRYDDGFIAYLNGAEILRVNIDPSAQVNWDSAASLERDDAAGRQVETFDLSAHLTSLRVGNNVLAIHGLNADAADSDFLLSVELVAHEVSQGDVAPTALPYTGAIELTRSIHVKARAFNGTWSALNEATYSVGPVADNLRLTEIMYHPAFMGEATDRDAEFIELKNIGTESINLNLVRFLKGIDFTFGPTDLAAGEYITVVKDPAVFMARHPEFSGAMAGPWSGSLDNAGERIVLVDAAGRVIHDFKFKDGWFDITDGDGFSLTVRTPSVTPPQDWGLKTTWRPSAAAGGSPGFDDTGFIPEPGAVVINEILAHSHALDPDWIELYNTTDAPIVLGGWFLSDSASNLMKYEIGPDVSIPAGGCVVFYEHQHFGNSNDPGCRQPFGLSENGETVCLRSGQGGVLTGYAEQEDFGASETNVAFGRYQKSTGTFNFVAMSSNTPGGPNAYPKVGPVVISEIMYNPAADSEAEYVELLNISGAPLALYDFLTGEPWKFQDEGGIDLPILDAQGRPITMAADERILLVKNSTAFAAAFASPAQTQIVAWGTGSLSNGGERIQLSMPGDVDSKGVRQYIRVDRVVYSDGSHPLGDDPWPAGADGGGASLVRIDNSAYGNDPVNWQAGVPSPGD
ncbi:MAG: lamin tail domain-containing protein [Phycisphaerae bacterium]|nr:lamin tail domain-containing protein [Phycisphaerae bacterium]